MRQVDACDFCGDAPDGVFEVVPAAVPDGPVRLALCADCRTTLETVVDPLLAADASEESGSEDAEPTGHQPADADAESTATAAVAPGTDDDAEAAPNTPTAMRDSGDDGSSREETAGDSPTGSADDSDGGTATVDDSAGESGDEDGITIEEQGGGTPAERPDGYAQVLRLLENRNGGMARDDLRALATNAYDLTDRTFEAAVDAAVENGDVEDTSGGLRRT